MIWQNAFLDTRWRFLVGLVLLTVSAMFVALGYPTVVEVAKAAPAAPAGGPLGREIAEALALSRTYDGYVWSQWFRQNGAQLGSFFAVIIGTGGLLSQSSAARLFTLSLPVSRERLLGARATAGLAQVLALSVVPALTITSRVAARGPAVFRCSIRSSTGCASSPAAPSFSASRSCCRRCSPTSGRRRSWRSASARWLARPTGSPADRRRSACSA